MASPLPISPSFNGTAAFKKRTFFVCCRLNYPNNIKKQSSRKKERKVAKNIFFPRFLLIIMEISPKKKV